MKKVLLSACAFAPAFLFGQTSLLTENFDSYTAGNTVVAEAGGVWDTWSGGAGTAEDAMVSSAQSSSPSNSMNVVNGGPGAYENDMILELPSLYTAGVYEFKCKIYVTQGNGGYFNLGGAWTSGGAGYQYGADIFFNTDGSGAIDAPGTGAFNYTQDSWTDVSIIVNFGTGMKTVLVDGNIIINATWGAAGGFGVADFFGVAYTDGTLATEGTSDFYVDDIELLDWTGVGLDENNLSVAMNVVPNPSNGEFAINLNDATAGDYQLTITDIAGNVLKKEVIAVNGVTSVSVNLDVPAGIYFVNLNDGNKTATQKVMIK